MASCINSRTGATGATCRKTSLPTRRYSGTTSSGAQKECWSESEMPCTRRFEPRSKKPKWTTLLLIDSQAVKNTCNASVESKGFCFYKSTNGIKRHLAVDRLGFPFFAHCTKANVSDDPGLIEMLAKNIDYFKDRTDCLPKITILLDNGYHPTVLITALAEIYPQIMTKIQFERLLSPPKPKSRRKGRRDLWSSQCDG